MVLPVFFLFAAIAVSETAPAPNQYLVPTADPSVQRAGQLLNANQPSQALNLLRAAIERHPRDPGVLLLAGLAAHRSDQLHAALGYWSQSLDLAPDNAALNAIYRDAQREAAADRSGARLYSPHIALRYENAAIPADAARSVLATLEEDYSRISAQLGCSPGERIVAIVQSREQYLRGTAAAEWSGGHYDGRIHVAWSASEPGEPGIGPRIKRALAHELVHACLMSLPSGSHPWPVWLQEGLAQKLSGDTLQLAVREQLRRLAVTHALPRLESLDQDWFSLPREQAVASYNLSLAAADALFDDYASHGILKILTNPETLPQITADLDAKLGL
jgi:tetratricopeptide (TPR) repeat protein